MSAGTAGLRRASMVLLLVAGLGCREGGPLRGLFHADSPYEQYLEALRQAGLDTTALGRDWVRAGQVALAQPVLAQTPFRETGYFPPQAPGAIAYQVFLRRGRKLAIEIAFASQPPGRWFVDLFRVAPDRPPDRVASLLPDSSLLVYEVRRDGDYLLRLQPELLRGGRYTLTQRTEASLGFPVPGSSTRAVRSGFGAERDAGNRSHQGIDIFAARGTPVVAVVEGIARPGTNELGGNVVWLRDAGQRRTLYYAHLVAWAPGSDGPVRIGDTLGYVGNSGNARSTPPHLHFGIYAGGPVDPLPFLLADDPAPAAIEAPTDRLDELVRVRLARVPLRPGPDPGALPLDTLTRGVLARISGAALGSYRVMLPDGSSGYVEARALVPASGGLGQEQLAAGTVLRQSPSASAPAVEILSSDTVAELLGRFAAFGLVRLDSIRVGWVRGDSARTGRR